MQPSPRTAKTTEALHALVCDNLDTGNFWILVQEDHVVITAQHDGQEPTTSIEIPKREFNKIVDFYNGSQRVAPQRGAGPERQKSHLTTYAIQDYEK